MAPTLDAVLLEGWAEAAATALERRCAEIDRINVFPVADRDTGTNLLLTMRAAVAAVRVLRRAGAPSPTGPGTIATAEALARGALLHARGNSGVILSQVLRGVAEAVVAAVAGGARCGGAALADGLARAARLAREAVSHPRDGTVLTVLAAAATAAQEMAVGRGTTVGHDTSGPDAGDPDAGDGDRLDEVAVAAAGAAAVSLRATTGQLPELALAGVVDAGGLGLSVVLDALAALLAGRGSGAGDLVDRGAGARGAVDSGTVDSGTVDPGPVDPGAVDPGPVDPGTTDRRGATDGYLAGAEAASAGAGPLAPPVSAPADAGPVAPGFEVMYLLDGADDARVAALRAALEGVGHAVAVVGDGAPGGTGTWTVHVHCGDIGAVLEAGVAAGRPHRVRVVPLLDPTDADGRFARARAVVAVTCGPDAAALAREAGVDVLARDPGAPDDVDEEALTAALAATGARHVVLLPCDTALGAVAERAAEAARRGGQEAVVVPAASTVAGLAALAVHDPARRASDDVVAMTEAAAGTRTGVLEVADAEALTWAGRCHPGDVLGLVDGEVVLIAPDIPVGALWLASRMVTAGGELVTVLLGAGVPDAVGTELAAQLRRTHPEVDVVVHRGGRAGRPMELGVE